MSIKRSSRFCLQALRRAIRPAPLCALALLAACQQPLPPAASAQPLPADRGDVLPARQPQRIVSLNLCTDQILLQLVDRSRIAALSRLATKPDMSMLAASAQGIAQVQGSAEEVLALQPDLVLAGTHTTRHTTQMLRHFGVPVLTLPGADALAQAHEHIRLVARATGDVARGQALVQAMQQAQADLAAQVAAEPHSAARPAAALYGGNGQSAGAGTIYDDMLTLAGWRNAAADAGVQRYGSLPLERLVATGARLLIVPEYGYHAQRAHQPLEHPVLAHLQVRRFALPSRMTVCGGPWNVQAAQLLAYERRALARPQPARAEGA